MTTRLKTVRLTMGLSVANLARLANMHTPNLYRLESGNEKAGRNVRARMAAALGLAESELFDSQGWPLRPAKSAAGGLTGDALTLRRTQRMEPNPFSDPILNLSAGADYCRRHPQTLRRAVKQGALSCLQACRRGRLYFRLSHLDAWLRGQERSASNLAAALGLAESELFDSQGWPLPAEVEP